MAVYATVHDIRRMLDREDLSDDVVAEADVLCIAASEYIENRTGRIFGAQSITQEQQLRFQQGIVLLDQFPVAAVSLVEGRKTRTSAWESLVASTDYELLVPRSGQLLIANPDSWYSIRATYTVTASVPEVVKLCTRMLVIHLLRPSLEGLLPGTKVYTVGPDMRVEIDAVGLPRDVKDLLDTLVAETVA